MASVQVSIVAVEEKVWSGEAEMLVTRTTEGEIGIMPGHQPLLGELVDPADVRVKTADGELAWKVGGGFLAVTSEGVSVLAESVMLAS